MRTVEIIYRYGDPDVPRRPRPMDPESARVRLNEGNRAFATMLEGMMTDDVIAKRTIQVDPQDLGPGPIKLLA